MKIETKNYVVTFEDTPEMHKKVFDRVVQFYKDHESFHWECIMQCDNPQIEAPSVLADIADDIIKFEVAYKED